MKKETARRKYRQSLRERQGEILQGMLAAKRDGKNVVQWLSEQGVKDVETRALFMEAMNKRLKSAKASDAPGGA